MLRSSPGPFPQPFKAKRQVLCKLERNYGSRAKALSLETARWLVFLAQRASQTLRTSRFLIKVALSPNRDTQGTGHPGQLGRKRRLRCQRPQNCWTRGPQLHAVTRAPQRKPDTSPSSQQEELYLEPRHGTAVLTWSHSPTAQSLCSSLHFMAEKTTAQECK